MLTHSELKELSVISGNGDFFISLYLNVNPITNPKGDYVIHFKNLLKDIMGKVGKDIEKRVKGDLEKIEAYLTGNKREFKKGLALISSSPRGLWKNYHLSLPVKNELIIDKTPYVKPLVDLLDNYQRYVTLLVAKESARIFLIHLGEIEEYTEVFTADIPGKHKKGGWFALKQNRYERHIDYHVSLHMKDVVKAVEELLHREYIGMIIIGGAEQAIVKVKGLLPQVILDKVIGQFPAEMFAGENDILNMSMKIMEEFEKNKEQMIVDELITRAMKNNMAVIGLEDVLASIQEGSVMKLVFLRGSTAQGFMCTNCGFLTSQALKNCPYCKGVFEAVSYLIDFAVQKAVEQGALIEVVTDSKKLADAGGIGAFLRF
ncbi:MAG: hypothetical protein HZC12_07400 [Nitrospirae bacterium]|nr:hypothetical protein [Nitrospirota bacterium]